MTAVFLHQRISSAHYLSEESGFVILVAQSVVSSSNKRFTGDDNRLYGDRDANHLYY